MTSADDSSAAEGLQVAVVLTHALLREGICHLLRAVGAEVAGSFASAGDAAALAGDAPDLTLLGWDSADMTTATVSRLVEAVPDTKVVVLAGIQMPYDEKVMREMVEAGAAGCLSVDLSPSEFGRSLVVLARGDLVVSREIVRSSADPKTPGAPEPLPSDLTEREREVLACVAEGATNKEVAATLEVAESTVKAHLNHILNKLDLRNRQQAAAFATRYALLSVPPKK